MRGSTSSEYHCLRAAAELKRAAEAADPKTAALHRELAELHLLGAHLNDDPPSSPAPAPSGAFADSLQQGT